MIPTVAFVFLLIGFVLAMYGSTLDDVERPAPRKRHRRRTARAPSTASATKLTIVPREHERG